MEITMGDVIHVNFAREHEKREFEQEKFIVFTDVRGDEYEIQVELSPAWVDDLWDDIHTPEDHPLPETEKTLFGWSVRVWDYRLKSWFTLPDFFLTEDSALCRAEMYLMAIDYNPHNDNGGNYV